MASYTAVDVLTWARNLRQDAERYHSDKSTTLKPSPHLVDYMEAAEALLACAVTIATPGDEAIPPDPPKHVHVKTTILVDGVLAVVDGDGFEYGVGDVAYNPIYDYYFYSLWASPSAKEKIVGNYPSRLSALHALEAAYRGSVAD